MRLVDALPKTTTDQLVQAVLDGVEGCETGFVSPSGKRIGACIACLGCAKDNVCKVKDDIGDLRAKILEADAYVIGGANYFLSCMPPGLPGRHSIRKQGFGRVDKEKTQKHI